MALAVRIRCYVCNRDSAPQATVFLNRDEQENNRQIAIVRRGTNNLPAAVFNNDNSRICRPCHLSIINEIRILNDDPTALRLNVLTQTASESCLICNAVQNVHRLSIQSRTDIFLATNIYVPENVRSCAHHLDDNGYLLRILLNGLRSINRPYIIKGPQLQIFLQELKNVANTQKKFKDETCFTDEEFICVTPITKIQFLNLFTYCDPVPQQRGLRHVSKKDLLTFLCKMKHGLPDNFLKVIFGYSTRQAVSLVIQTVRQSLSRRFVPENVGFGSITRQTFMQTHVTPFANELYNPEPEQRKAIVGIDATYTYMQKSKNFATLRNSYSQHKHSHLAKPTPIVAMDGFILAILPPYFSDGHNNDAAILRSEFARIENGMSDWFQNGDIFLVDRGYRDAIPWLEERGFVCWMPSLIEEGQRQLTTEQANLSRIVTKNRWVVEIRNGHFRYIFKFLDGTIIMPHMHHIYDYYNIAAAIINKYRPLILMQQATVELAREIKRRSEMPNIVQAYVELENLRRRPTQWILVNENVVPDFPILTLEYLRNLTVGVYQVNLAPSYIQDKLDRDGDEQLQIEEHINQPGFIRLRLYSRFRRAKTHHIFIAYRTAELQEDGNDEDDEDQNELILGYYCTCQSGARTLGSCAHVAMVLFYLGYARHELNIKSPDDSLLNILLYADQNPNQNQNYSDDDQ